MWDLLLCFLPSLLLLAVAALLRWSPVRGLLKRSSRWVTWILWSGVCWVLELPVQTWGDGGLDVAKEEPSLVCKPTALAHHLLLHCRTLLHPTLAAGPRGDPHLQTLSSLFWPAEGTICGGAGRVHFTREHLLLNDGGIVALDWAMVLREEPLLGAKCEQPPGMCRGLCCRSGSGGGSSSVGSPRILLLIPNCLGVVTPHLQRLCCTALQQGYYPVVFNRRGLGSCPLTTPRYQEFGDPRDLMQAVAYLRSRHPSATLLAISEGSGSGLLLSYLGECGSSSYLTAAACISPVFHGRLWFEMSMPSLYHRGALFYRKLQISRYASAVSGQLDVEKILHCRSLRDMEELMFCGTQKPTEAASGESQTQTEMVRGWEAYWERNEPLRDADDVAVPVLCLCSADDPLVPPASTIPTSLFTNSPYFLLALTARGGHCGFAQAGTGKRGASSSSGSGSWSHEAALEYLRVVNDFLKGEERRRSRWVPGHEMEDLSPTQARNQGWRHRSGTLLACRRKPVLPVRRERHQTHQPSNSDFPEDLFIWNRAYTR